MKIFLIDLPLVVLVVPKRRRFLAASHLAGHLLVFLSLVGDIGVLKWYKNIHVFMSSFFFWLKTVKMRLIAKNTRITWLFTNFHLTAQTQVMNIIHHTDHTFKFKIIILINFITLFKKPFFTYYKNIFFVQFS